MKQFETRQGWMNLLAKAPDAALNACFQALGPPPAFIWLRAPEPGGVMVQGRAGGTGAPFNLGEMTVTRCALRLSDGGAVGHAYVQGRNRVKAEQAALVDAMMQTPQADLVRDVVLSPLAKAAQDARQARAEKAAATKVDFFTLMRGED